MASLGDDSQQKLMLHETIDGEDEEDLSVHDKDADEFDADENPDVPLNFSNQQPTIVGREADPNAKEDWDDDFDVDEDSEDNESQNTNVFNRSTSLLAKKDALFSSEKLHPSESQSEKPSVEKKEALPEVKKSPSAEVPEKKEKEVWVPLFSGASVKKDKEKEKEKEWVPLFSGASAKKKEGGEDLKPIKNDWGEELHFDEDEEPPDVDPSEDTWIPPDEDTILKSMAAMSHLQESADTDKDYVVEDDDLADKKAVRDRHIPLLSSILKGLPPVPTANTAAAPSLPPVPAKAPDTKHKSKDSIDVDSVNVELKDDNSEAGSNSEADWDEEFRKEEEIEKGVADEDVPDKARSYKNLLGDDDSDSDDENEGVVPVRFRLLKILSQSSKKKIQIVMYPTPSRLFTLRLDSGLNAFQERELETFLESICAKRKKDFFNYEEVPTWKGDELDLFKKLPTFSLDSKGQPVPRDLNLQLKLVLLRMRQLYRSRQERSLVVMWSIIQAVFAYLNEEIYNSELAITSQRVMREKMQKEKAEREAAEAEAKKKKSSKDKKKSEQKSAKWDLPPTPNKIPAEPSFFNQETAFRWIYDILFMGAKTWTRDKAEVFNYFCEIAKEFFPKYAPLIQLLESETLAHHDGSFANTVIRQFCSLFHVHSKLDKATPNAVSVEVASRALTSLHLYLSNYSPLNTSLLAAEARWDIEDDGFDWMERAWMGEKPPVAQQSDLENLTWELCGVPERRMEALRSLYPRLPVSFLKARCAYTLGRYVYDRRQDQDVKSAEDSAREAEGIIFEGLFILDQIQALMPNSVPIISELGVHSLVLYGDVLMINGKYKYAVLSYESACQAYKYLKGVDYHQLIRRLCDLCTENEDWKRSITYHEIIKEKATRDGNLNMYLFIVQQISKIQVSRGNFRRAEENLRSALKFLRPLSRRSAQAATDQINRVQIKTSKPSISGVPASFRQNLTSSTSGLGMGGVGGTNAVGGKFNSTPAAEFRNAILSLYITLARLYLNGDRVTNAINVLEMLRKSELPRNKVSVVHLLLATAYMKKRQFVKANELLDRMEHMGSPDQVAHDKPGYRARASTQPAPLSMMGNGLSLNFGDVINTTEFMEIRAKGYLYMGHYDKALHWVDMALQTCTPSSLTLLARLHYRKGKVLQAMLFSEMMNQYQSHKHAMKAAGAEEDPNLDEEIMDPASFPYLPDPKACIQAFTDAHEYFRKIDDNIRMAKCLCRISETYLHVAFVVVAVLGHSPQELLPWLETAGFSVVNEETAFKEFLERVSQPALHAMEICAESLHPVLLLQCYINLAEIRFLQDKFASALAFWKECADTYFSLFMNGSQSVLITKATPGFSANMKTFFKRVVRLLMCLDSEQINQNLIVLDAYILYEVDLFSELLASYEDHMNDAEMRQSFDQGRGPGSLGSTMQYAHEAAQHSLHTHNANAQANSDPNANPASRSLSNSPRTMARKKQEPWKEHLNVAFGAVGSRSAGTRNDRRVSFMSSRFADDDDTQRQALNLAESVCFALYEISRTCDQYSVGRYSAEDVADRNRASVRRVLKYMASLRQLTGQDKEAAKRASALSQQQQARRASLELAVAAIVGSPSVPPTAAEKALRAATPNSFDPRTTASLTRSVSMWLLSSRSAGDPLWGNLTYCLPMDCYTMLYSPLLKTKMVRLYTEPSLALAPNAPLLPAARLLPHTVALSSHDHHPSLSSTASAGSNSSFPSPTSPPDTPKTYGNSHTKSGTPSMHIDPEFHGAGAAVSHFHPAHTHIIPNSEFLQELLRDFRARALESNARAPTDHDRASSFDNDFGQQQETLLELRRKEREQKLAAAALASGLGTVGGVDEVELASVAVNYLDEDASEAPSDSVRCEECECQWFAEHYWDRGFCRNCFHVHVKRDEQSAVLRDERLRSKLSHGAHASESNAVPPLPSFRGAPSGNTLKPIPSGGQNDRDHDKQNSFSLVGQGLRRSAGAKLSLRAADSLVPPALDIVYVKEMFNSLDPQNILTLLAALFGECRIIFCASSHFRIKAVINSLLRLMYPFQWQHMFIPVLGRENVGLLDDTEPYIIGINSYILDAIPPAAPGVVIAHLDKNFVRYSPGSFINFPPKYKNRLYKAIVRFMSSMFIHQTSQVKRYRQQSVLSEHQLSHRGLSAQELKLNPDDEDYREDLLLGPDNAQRALVKQSTEKRLQQMKIEQEKKERARSTMNDASADPLPVSKPSNADFRALNDSQFLHLRALRDGFLLVFVSLFYKYRLFWREEGDSPLDLPEFLDYTKQECQPFIQSFVRTKAFQYFVNVRAQLPTEKLGYYLFDSLVEDKLREAKEKLERLRAEKEQGPLIFAHGNGSWNQRHAVLDASVLHIFKTKKSSSAKHTRVLTPGEFRVMVPVVEANPTYYSFELSEAVRRNPPKHEPYSFRATSIEQRKRWVTMLNARVMSPSLRLRYDTATTKLAKNKKAYTPIQPPMSPPTGALSTTPPSGSSSNLRKLSA